MHFSSSMFWVARVNSRFRQHSNIKASMLTLTFCYVFVISLACCWRQEEPTILISRLLLRMRRTYVDSIRLDFH